MLWVVLLSCASGYSYRLGLIFENRRALTKLAGCYRIHAVGGRGFDGLILDGSWWLRIFLNDFGCSDLSQLLRSIIMRFVTIRARFSHATQSGDAGRETRPGA